VSADVYPGSVTRTETAERVKLLVDSRRQFLAFVERRVGDRAAAEEILQTAYVKGAEKADGVRDRESVVAWFYRVLRNAIADHFRRRGAEERALERYARELDPSAEDVELLDAVCSCVGRLLLTLKPEYEQVVRAVDLEGRDVRAVAEATGISANNVSVRLHRARQALRRQLERACGACATHGCLDCTCRSAEPRSRF
jgi:RNA polymerase sigma factor (sigma-70 family)